MRFSGFTRAFFVGKGAISRIIAPAAAAGLLSLGSHASTIGAQAECALPPLVDGKFLPAKPFDGSGGHGSPAVRFAEAEQKKFMRGILGGTRTPKVWADVIDGMGLMNVLDFARHFRILFGSGDPTNADRDEVRDEIMAFAQSHEFDMRLFPRVTRDLERDFDDIVDALRDNKSRAQTRFTADLDKFDRSQQPGARYWLMHTRLFSSAPVLQV